MIPDFSTWHAVRSAKPMDLFIYSNRESAYGGCVCYIRGLNGSKVQIEIPLMSVPLEVECRQLSKFPQ